MFYKNIRSLFKLRYIITVLIVQDILQYIFYSLFVKLHGFIYNEYLYIIPIVYIPKCVIDILYYFSINIIYKRDDNYYYSRYKNNISGPILKFQLECYTQTDSLVTNYSNDIIHYNNTLPIEFIIIDLYHEIHLWNDIIILIEYIAKKEKKNINIFIDKKTLCRQCIFYKFFYYKLKYNETNILFNIIKP